MLRKKREEKGLSRRALSEASGVPYRTLEYWEIRGVDRATVGNLKKVAKTLGCKTGDLIGD